MKICIHCKLNKELCEFTDNKNYPDGKFCYCRLCLLLLSKGGRSKGKRTKLPYLPLPAARICTKCKEEKHFTEFPIDKSNRDGFDRECKACIKIKAATQLLKHGDRYNAVRRERRASDPEYRQKTLDGCKRYAKSEAGRKSRQESSRKYYETHKRQHFDLIYARRQKFIREMTADDWRRIMLLHRSLCFYCGGKATGKDHVLPICLGGRDTVDNTIPCCPTCNKKKSSTRVEVWVTRHFSEHEEILDRLQEALTLQRWLYARQEAA